ncbi:MAG: sigma-70 family RNA polymerase sigma factor [Pirellulales bacterium]|nr:sigma-70 family RNA polymerase sigma factor [Pirellulales bacterium]
MTPGNLGQYRPYLRVLAAGRLDDRFQAKLDASDLVQLALLKAHKNLAGFRGNSEAELLAWLRQILATVVIDQARRFNGEKRDIRIERSLHSELDKTSTNLISNLTSRHPTPSQILLHEECVAATCAAIDLLPDEQQRAIILKYLRDESVATIAKKMGKTEAAIGGLLRRGMRRLREKMGDT